jgi:tetratricopeptide (TPR) repeat protein
MSKARTYKYFIFLVNLLWFSASNAQDFDRIDSLHHAVVNAKKPELKVNALIQIGQEYESCNVDSALKYARLALNLSRQADYSKGIVKSLIQEGRMLVQKNDFSTAMKLFESSIEIAEQHDMTNDAAIAYGVIAMMYGQLGNYDNSAKYNFKSLELFEKVNNKFEIGVTLGNIAADLNDQNNFEKALDYMNQALNIAKEIKDKAGIAYQYNNIAGVYYAGYKDYKKALAYYFKAFDLNQEQGDKMLLGSNYLNIGYCYSQLNTRDSVLPYFEKALKIFIDLKNPIYTASGDIALGKYYLENNDFDKCLKYASEALTIGMNQNSYEIISEASEILHKLYLSKKDIINAYKYSQLNFQARDSLQAMQSQKTLFKLEYQYNFEKQDKERKLKQQRSNFVMGLLILGLFSGIIIILLIYSRQRIKIKNSNLEKQKMASELSFKNKELTINLMALKKKNEILSEISKKLIIIEKKVPRDDLPAAINKLNKDLKKTTDEKVWKEFDLRFSQTNSDFYEKLLRKYPDLTQSELKLSAYLRLNMTSKEIAEMTGQRVLTLENARYRLRKKLGITGSDNNLVNFLCQI